MGFKLRQMNTLTEAEREAKLEVLKQDYEDKEITVRCPDCGGKIILDKCGNSSEIYCENHCFKSTLRGI